MSVPEIYKYKSVPDAATENSSNAIFLTEKSLESDSQEIKLASQTISVPDLARIANAIGFKANSGQLERIFAPELQGNSVYLVGLGKDIDDEALRNAGGTLARALKNCSQINLLTENLALTPDQITTLATAVAIASYDFEGYRSSTKNSPLEQINIISKQEISPELWDEMSASVAAVALSKDLINTPARDLGPEEFVAAAKSALSDLPVKVTVLDENELKEQGFGGILSVGSGSARPPRLLQLDYEPNSYQEYIALVGKGITFDTGGLSLKPATSMVGMKYDMAGAATVLSVIKAVAELKLEVKVSAWLCLAENMPSGSATRPGDVATIANGKTVEILNTDAEGRLVLADGLVAASRTSPDLIIDVATLTGAITVALGTRHVGVMGDENAGKRYLSAAEKAGEGAWMLPLPSYLEEQLKSQIADMVNAKIGDPAAGSLFAGVFLEKFIDSPEGEKIPWIHLDIAGAGMNKGAAYGLNNKGPTAVTVRSLIKLISEAANV